MDSNPRPIGPAGVADDFGFDAAGDAPATFDDAIVTETIRLVETRGPLEDAQAMRTAAHAPLGREQQVTLRARLLGERFDLAGHLERARALGPLLIVAIAVAAIWSSLRFALPRADRASLGKTGRKLRLI